MIDLGSSKHVCDRNGTIEFCGIIFHQMDCIMVLPMLLVKNVARSLEEKKKLLGGKGFLVIYLDFLWKKTEVLKIFDSVFSF